jgi:hypothetical protein
MSTAFKPDPYPKEKRDSIPNPEAFAEHLRKPTLHDVLVADAAPKPRVMLQPRKDVLRERIKALEAEVVQCNDEIAEAWAEAKLHREWKQAVYRERNRWRMASLVLAVALVVAVLL